MKTLTLTTIAALTLAAPAVAEVTDAEAYFLLSNDSAAERILPETSEGNPLAAEEKFAMSNDSAAEIEVLAPRARVNGADTAAIEQFFALSNDSAAERIVR